MLTAERADWKRFSQLGRDESRQKYWHNVNYYGSAPRQRPCLSASSRKPLVRFELLVRLIVGLCRAPAEVARHWTAFLFSG